jgi:MFS family permease
MKKMVWLFGALGFLLAGYYATWQVNLLTRGFEIQHIATLIAISTGLSLVIDVPTGVLADRIGHKKTVLAGILVYCAGFLVPALASDAFAVAVAVVTIAVGDALIEGALESWTADIQSAEGGTITNHQFMSLDQAQRFGMILGAIAIPGLVSLSGATVQASWFFYVGAGLLVFVLAKSIPAAKEVSKVGQKKPTVFGLIAEARSPGMIFILVATFVYGLSDATIQVGFWPRIKELGISEPILLGLIQSGMSLSRLAGLQTWKRSGRAEATYVPSVALIGSSVFFVAFSIVGSPYGALMLWFVRVAILSAYFAALRGLIQRRFKDSPWRAALASVVGTATQVGVICGSAVLGFVPGLDAGWVLILGSGLCVLSGFMFLWARKGIHS